MIQLTETQKTVALGALAHVALAHGGIEPQERLLLEAAAEALGVAPSGDFEPATPQRVAEAFPDDLARRRVLEGMVAMACIDGEATDDEVRAIEAYGAALGVDDPWVKNLRRVVEGRIALVRVDMARRLEVPRAVFVTAWEKEGVLGLVDLMRRFAGGGKYEPELAWRYRQLGLLPANTLGRAFWEHMTSRRFGFPGEPGGIVEHAVYHDVLHVLTGYDTDPEGEAQIASYLAGFQKEEPFGYVFMVLVMFGLGKKLAPAASIQESSIALDPRKLARALERGMQLKVDVTKGWDHWPHMPRPIDDVRAELGIA
jgi:tellurite resistance protein